MAALDNFRRVFETTVAEDRAFLERMWRLENTERPGFMFGYVGPRVNGGSPVTRALFSLESEGTVIAAIAQRILSPPLKA